MIFEYTCPRCNNKFTSPMNAIREHVVCPYCQQQMAGNNISLVIDNPVNAGSSTVRPDNPQPVQGRPVQGRPVQGRTVQGKPVQGRPVLAQPIQAQPVITMSQPNDITPPSVSPQYAPPEDIPVTQPVVAPIDPIEPIANGHAPIASTSNNPFENNPSNVVAPEQDNRMNETPTEDETLDDMLINKSLAAVDETEEQEDYDVEVADELKDAFDNGNLANPHPLKKGKLFAVFGGLIILLIAVCYLLFFSKSTNTEQDGIEMAKNNEKAAVDSLKAYAQANPDAGIKEYFMIDLNQDGQKEVLANSDKQLIVYGAKEGIATQLYNKPVLEWVWLRGKGLFVVFSSDDQSEGSAVWLKQNATTLVEDSTQENYSHTEGKFAKSQNGSITNVSEDDYYGFINVVIKNYTKLTPIKLQ